MRWFRISSVPVRDRRSGGTPPSGALLVAGGRPPRPPRAWCGSASLRVRADFYWPGCSLWVSSGLAHPNVPPHFRRRENHSYVLHLWPRLSGRFPQTSLQRPGTALTRRFEKELASTFEGLLEAQNADQGRGYSLGAGCQRDPDGGTTVSLVKIQARRERHAVLFE
jgi:hypothetical protein